MDWIWNRNINWIRIWIWAIMCFYICYRYWMIKGKPVVRDQVQQHVELQVEGSKVKSEERTRRNSNSSEQKLPSGNTVETRWKWRTRCWSIYGEGNILWTYVRSYILILLIISICIEQWNDLGAANNKLHAVHRSTRTTITYSRYIWVLVLTTKLP